MIGACVCVCDYMDQNVCVAREYCATCNVSHDTGVEGRQSKPRYSTQNTHTQQERERNVEGQKARGTRRERESSEQREETHEQDWKRKGERDV